MKYEHGELISRILNLFEQHTALTRAEIRQLLGVPNETIRSVMSRLTHNGPKTGKRLYIAAWCMDAHGERRYPRAIYALYKGKQHKDALKPKGST